MSDTLASIFIGLVAGACVFGVVVLYYDPDNGAHNAQKWQKCIKACVPNKAIDLNPCTCDMTKEIRSVEQ